MQSERESIPWDTIAAVRSGDSRKAVFQSVAEKPCYAAEIASDQSFSREVASKQIHWLREKGLVECLTADRPHCRIYGLTEAGEEVYEYL